MSTTLTSEERLEQVDREVEALKAGYIQALEQLQSSPEVDDSFQERWQNIERRLRDLRSVLEPEDFDKDQIVDLYRTLLDIRDLLERDADHEVYDNLLISIERIRHIVRDALDEHVNGISGDVGRILEELNSWLPKIPQHELATLVGVDRRTLARWAGKAGVPSRRLRAVARVVAILRHNWTPDGIVAWFHHERRDLGGRTPLAVLNDKNFDEEALVMAARSGRSQYAT